MANKNVLSKEDLETIELWDTSLKDHVDTEKDGVFNVGDILIEEYIYENTVRPNTSSTGVIRKFKVVHISKAGVPCIKPLTIKGNTSGCLRLLPRHETILHYGADNISDIEPDKRWRFSAKHDFQRFVLDPQQLDNIILGEELDPMADARDHRRIWVDVNRHNQENKINTSKTKIINAFLVTLRPGDKIWTTPDRFYLVQTNITNDVGRPHLTVLTYLQEVEHIEAEDLLRRRIYRQPPRSYHKEISN